MKIWILLFLIMAAIYDYRDFKIPNKLNGAGALITLVLAEQNCVICDLSGSVSGHWL